MKDEAVGELVGTLCDRYGVTPDDAMVTLWWNNFHETPQPVIDAALAAYLAAENFMPKPAKFREYLSMEMRKATRTAPPNRCTTCEGSGWVEGPEERGVTFPSAVYETVAPCPACSQRAAQRKAEVWDKEASPRRRASDDEKLYPSNPQKGLASVRAALAKADALARNPDDLF